MSPVPGNFEKTVLLGWSEPSVGKVEFEEAAARLWEPEPGISVQAVYSMEDRDGHPLPEPIARVSGWSAVARVGSDGCDIAWMRAEDDGVDVLSAAIIAWDRPRPPFEKDLLGRGLTLFLDAYGSDRHSAWKVGEGPGCVVLHDPVSSFLTDTREAPASIPAEITVDGRYFAHHASTLVETSLTVGVLAEYMASHSATDRIRILVPCDHSLLLSAARTRAMRLLAARVARAFSYPLDQLEIWGLVEHACGCPDRSTHQIRSSAGAIGAVLGTCDRVVLEPFRGNAQPDRDSLRLALNILRILKLESRLGTPQDPLRGAYYVEALTRQIVDRCWDMFLDVEDAGGILHVAEESSVSQFLGNHILRGAGNAEA